MRASASAKEGCSDPLLPSSNKSGRYLMDHEYHEISDEENGVESPRFEKSFDFGPSLLDEMDAMFKSLGSCKLPKPASPPPSPPPGPTLFAAATSSTATGAHEEAEDPKDLAHNVRNELREMAARRTLESAIAMANELASRSMHELEGGSEASPPPESPHTPASPNKRKFSFKFAAGSGSKTSPKAERRNFAEEAASIPDIQSTLTEEARAAYNSLVEAPLDSTVGHDGSDEACNPLRMLRSGVPVRPRVRGNKQRHKLERQPVPTADWASCSSRSLPRHHTIPVVPPPPPTTPAPVNRLYSSQRRPDVPPPIPPPPAVQHSYQTQLDSTEHEDTDESSGEDHAQNNHQDIDLDDESGEGNPIPVPPRDRKPQLTNKPRHQRKHPLIIPGGGVSRTIVRMSGELDLDLPPELGDEPVGGKPSTSITNVPSLSSSPTEGLVARDVSSSKNLAGSN
ncbi:hypothetical protein B566_EDAN014971 [Ephemera danica]|nr:hypothetical protein B566_EDAN014971 [Ephemera danica]